MLKLLLFVSLILAIAWLVMRVLRASPSPAGKPATRITSGTSAYHAVSLQYSNNACDAAKEMTGRRYLSSAAPQLPLPGCDALECRCQFTHHSDRRSGSDRRSPFNPGVAPGGTGTFKVERRQNKDRRKNADLNES